MELHHIRNDQYIQIYHIYHTISIRPLRAGGQAYRYDMHYAKYHIHIPHTLRELFYHYIYQQLTIFICKISVLAMELYTSSLTHISSLIRTSVYRFFCMHISSRHGIIGVLLACHIAISLYIASATHLTTYYYITTRQYIIFVSLA